MTDDNVDAIFWGGLIICLILICSVAPSILQEQYNGWANRKYVEARIEHEPVVYYANQLQVCQDEMSDLRESMQPQRRPLGPNDGGNEGF